jgi:sugar-specific transcriptional regulator TrmB
LAKHDPKQSEASTSLEYDSVKTETVSKLRELGLTSYGARAFLAIVESQPISATGICEKTRIPDSKIYYALKELEEKRLIMIQHGTPSTYRLNGSKQILSSLEGEIESEYKRKIESMRKLEKSLEPLIVRSSGGNSDVELAYIVKGFKNVMEKMKEIVLQARKEIVFMASDERLVLGLQEVIEQAKYRHEVSVKIALADKLLESKEFKTKLRSNRSLCCDCNIVITDSEKLVSAELGDPEHQCAIVTQNQGMIILARKSYDNPSCCC